MRETVLTRNDNGDDSIAWALEIHAKIADLGLFNFAVLNGNEDAPEWIDFYTSNNPDKGEAHFRWIPAELDVEIYGGTSPIKRSAENAVLHGEFKSEDLDLAAQQAAQATLDAHGEMWPPQDVWDFLRCNSDNDGYPVMRRLPAQMPRQFVHDYKRHYRLLTEGK